jgi:hypothetical protein
MWTRLWIDSSGRAWRDSSRRTTVCCYQITYALAFGHAPAGEQHLRALAGLAIASPWQGVIDAPNIPRCII